MIRIVFRFQGKRAMAYDFNTEIGECNKKIKVRLIRWKTKSKSKVLTG